MQQWLTIIIVLLIVAVLLDGIRRMRQSRRSSLKMSLSMHKGISKEELEEYGSELPNGGARVLTGGNSDAPKAIKRKQKKQTQQKKKPKVQKKQQSPDIPQQVALNLEESVPMLMDSVVNDEEPLPEIDEANTETYSADSFSTKKHETYETLEQPDDSSTATRDIPSNPQSAAQSPSPKNVDAEYNQDLLDDFDDTGRIEPQISSSAIATNDEYQDEQPFEDDYPDEVVQKDRGEQKAPNNESERYESADEILGLISSELIEDPFAQKDEEPCQETKATESHATDNVPEGQASAKRTEKVFSEDYSEEFSNDFSEDISNDKDNEEHYSEPEMVFVINIMARNGEKMSGGDLLRIVLAEGMRFGNMDIFHHHAEANGDGCVFYSMANMVMPGTFNLRDMDNLHTPGVSLFLALPLEEGNSSLQAFSRMLQTAQAISTQLGADLKDENRSVLTRQTIEHYRQRISDFERKQLSKAPA